jgi:hypothetical protein
MRDILRTVPNSAKVKHAALVDVLTLVANTDTWFTNNQYAFCVPTGKEKKKPLQPRRISLPSRVPLIYPPVLMVALTL